MTNRVRGGEERGAPPPPLHIAAGVALLVMGMSALGLAGASAQTPTLEPSEPESPSPTPSQSASPTALPTVEPEGSTAEVRIRRPASRGSARPASRTHARPAAAASVRAIDDEFVPATLGIDPGETVTWRNDGEHVHTVTSDDGLFDSGVFESAATFSFTFAEPGTYPYFCQVHGARGGVGMAGTIVVGGGASGVQPSVEAAPPQTLPNTGAPWAAWVAAALAGIGMGLGLLLVARGD